MAEGLSVKQARAIAWSEVGSREAALVQRCALGDEEACGELVSEHQRMVYHLGLHLLGDHNEALDLSQEVFLRVFRTIHRFRGQSALRTWIYRIVVNQAHNRMRWWRRRSRAQQVSLEDHVRTHGDPMAAEAGANPDRLLARKQMASRIWAALAALPFEQKTAIVLREVDGLRYEEIAYSLGVAVGTVKSRLARARDAAGAAEEYMTPLNCPAVHRLLTDFHDCELPVQQHLAVELHLERCAACAEEAARFDEIGEALREHAAGSQASGDDLTGLRSNVVSRMRGEYEESWRGRFERTFEDLHLVWIGVSSAVATVICVAVALACLEFASPEREDSLAGIIAAMQSSNASMVRQAGDIDEIGRAVERSMSEEEAVLALATVVTREGRLVDLRLVNDGRDRQEIDGLLNAISTARFEPARYAGSPVPTNVNVLWLLARTTVRGKIS